jgi:hypothetical protein
MHPAGKKRLLAQAGSHHARALQQQNSSTANTPPPPATAGVVVQYSLSPSLATHPSLVTLASTNLQQAADSGRGGRWSCLLVLGQLLHGTATFGQPQRSCKLHKHEMN